MQDKILFLDFDGVLNSDEFNMRNGNVPWHKKVDPVAIAKLNKIVERTGCSIVISSSWRHHLPLVILSKILTQYGFLYPDNVISATPDLSNYLYAVERGEEIAEWLMQNFTKRYAIVDDNDIGDNLGLLQHFVQTDYRVGMTDEDVEKIVVLLGEDL